MPEVIERIRISGENPNSGTRDSKNEGAISTLLTPNNLKDCDNESPPEGE